MVLLRISEDQLLFNSARPYGFPWKANLVPKLILSVTMQTIVKSPLVTILHAIAGGGGNDSLNFNKSDYITKEQMGGISEEQLLFHPNEGVPEESADVQSA